MLLRQRLELLEISEFRPKSTGCTLYHGKKDAYEPKISLDKLFNLR